jgi:hypothetical protein
MGGQAVEAVQVVGGQAAVQAAAEALGGLGGVLGDVPGDLLSRELPGLVAVDGDVVDVELLTLAGHTGPARRPGAGKAPGPPGQPAVGPPRGERR